MIGLADGGQAPSDATSRLYCAIFTLRAMTAAWSRTPTHAKCPREWPEVRGLPGKEKRPGSPHEVDCTKDMAIYRKIICATDHFMH
jgi:hypothetical protein